MKKLKRVISLLIAAAMVTAIVSCKKEITAEDLMANISEADASGLYLDDGFSNYYCVAAFKMLESQYSSDGPNVVISPLATFFNLSMLSNGASGWTKTQLEKSLSNSFSTDVLNTYMHSITENNVNNETAKLYFENAMWFNADKNIEVNNDFLVAAKTFYDASAFRETFSATAAGNINNWASNKTDMYVENIVKDVPSDLSIFMQNITVMDADWESPISPENVLDGVFTTPDAVEQNVQMMSSYEAVYIGDDKNVDGFAKKYAGGNYAFIAMIPKYESKNALVTFINYLAQNRNFRNFIDDRKDYRIVDASIPKFSCEYSGGIKEMVKPLNVDAVFSPESASLNNIGTCDEKLYISDVNIYTGLNVTERGTSKGTGANVNNTAVATNAVPVSLNRPFVFAVVDTKRYLPIILGAVNSVKD